MAARRNHGIRTFEPWLRNVTAGQARLVGAGVHAFRPYQPPPVPSGSYDPSLDAQLGQSKRGLGDLRADTETANTRDTVDYSTMQGDVTQQRDRTLADLNSQLEAVGRSYTRLGGRQTEGANAAGLLGGGALLQAAQKRAANEAIDRKPINTAMTRTTADAAEQLQKLALDYAPASADNPLGGRRFQDRTTALTRAQREGSQFGIDVNNQKLYQASQVGYVAPGRGQPGGIPSNERVTATGLHTRTRRVGNVIYTYDQHGNILERRRLSGPGSGRHVGPNTASGVGRI